MWLGVIFVVQSFWRKMAFLYEGHSVSQTTEVAASWKWFTTDNCPLFPSSQPTFHSFMNFLSIVSNIISGSSLDIIVGDVVCTCTRGVG